MVRAGCVFVAGIHPSRTWMSGSFESVRWNACVHRLDLGLYSHPKEFWGNGVWTHVNSKGKIPSTGKCPQRSIEPATLWQRAQALPAELLQPPSMLLFLFHWSETWFAYIVNLRQLQWQSPVKMQCDLWSPIELRRTQVWILKAQLMTKRQLKTV